MALRLFLMRHGKSNWSAHYSGDHERPLAERGITAAQNMGRLVRDARQLPEKIISSTALRASQTAEFFTQGSERLIPITLERDFYESSPQRVLHRVIKEEDPSSLMIVGHEPVWSMLAGQLIGDAHLVFPTAAIARIDCEIAHWSELTFGMGQLRWLLQPKFF